jgi:hypothetical protein
MPLEFERLSVLSNEATLLATVLGVLGLVSVVGAFAMFFIVAIGNRSDPDPAGSRPIAAYLFSGAFLFLWIAYYGVIAIADSLISLIGPHPAFFGLPSQLSQGNATIRGCALGALLLVVAGGIGLMHLHKGNALADLETSASGPTKRVMRSYVSLMSFISIILVVLGLVAALWSVFQLISPTVFLAIGTRTDTSKTLLDELVIVLLGATIFAWHQRFAPSGLRLFAGTHLGHLHMAHHDAPPPSPTPSA